MEAPNLRKFDLNLLVALDALLRERNVTRAGERIGITQSTMSADLRRLRTMFNDELLVRVGREYQLTALARELIDPVREVVAKVESTIAYRSTFDPTTESRRFSIAMTDYAMLLLLHPLLKRMESEAPGVALEVHPLRAQMARPQTSGVPEIAEALASGGNTEFSRALASGGAEFARALASGDADLVIGPALPTEDHYSQALFTDRFVCVVAADHPDVGDQMTKELFERLPHITAGWGPGTGSLADFHYREAGVHRRIDLMVESFALAPFLVGGTRLVATVQERLALRIREVARIKLLEPPVPAPDLEETMYWNALADADPAHVWLRRMIGEVAGALD